MSQVTDEELKLWVDQSRAAEHRRKLVSEEVPVLVGRLLGLLVEVRRFYMRDMLVKHSSR